MCVAAVVLFGLRLSLDDGVACLEMWRVSDDRETNHAVRLMIDALQWRAKVVLNVTAALVWCTQRRVELTENVFEWLTTDIRQHVQSTSSVFTTSTKYRRYSYCLADCLAVHILSFYVPIYLCLVVCIFVCNIRYWNFLPQQTTRVRSLIGLSLIAVDGCHANMPLLL